LNANASDSFYIGHGTCNYYICMSNTEIEGPFAKKQKAELKGGKGMRVAILGAGSLGTVVGAMLAKNKLDVVLVDGYKAHVEALNKKGATVTGKMNLNVPVTACDLDNIAGQFDLVLYLAKATNNPIYLPAILPHLKEDSIVCALQNGIPEERVAEYVGKERTVGGIVEWGATLREPGVTEMSSDPNWQDYRIGELDGSITPRIQMVKSVLDQAGKCNITENLISIRWSKVAVNSAFSGMSASLGCDYAGVLDNEKALLCAAMVKHELIQVVHALGIKLQTLQGQDFEEFELVNGKASFEDKKPLFYEWYKPHRKIIASMLFDLRLGRKCEIDAINGEVTSRGDKLGIDTPFNDKVVELVKEAEAKGTVPTMENLARFDELIAKLN